MGSDEDLRLEIAKRREALAASVGELRIDLARARQVPALERKLPLAVGAATAIGFLRAGGVGAAARLLGARSGSRSRKRFGFNGLRSGS